VHWRKGGGPLTKTVRLGRSGVKGHTGLTWTGRHIERLKSLPVLREAGLYIVINGIASLFPLVVLPAVTRTVAPADYGTYSIFLVGVTMLMPLVGLGMETAAGRRYVDRDSIDYPAYIATALAMTVVLSGAVYGLLILAAPALTAVTPIPIMWFWAWVLVAAAQTVSGLVLVMNQMANRPGAFGWWRIGRAAAVNGLMLVFVLAGLTGWADLIVVLVAAHGAVAVLGLIWLWRVRLVAVRLRLGHLTHLVAFGAPLIPHMIGAALITATDRILLANLIDEGAAGIYTVGYQMGQAIFLLSQSVNRAWTPWFYRQMSDGSHAAARQSVITGYWVAGGYIGAGLAYAAVGWFALPVLFGPVYATSTGVFVWIVAAFVAQGLWALVASYLYYREATGWISISSFGAAVLNVGFSYLLIQANGMIGAAQGTFAAYSIGCVVIIAVTVKKSALPWTLKPSI
jgi:O-antigen/teichoic acid export membrane protein